MKRVLPTFFTLLFISFSVLGQDLVVDIDKLTFTFSMMIIVQDDGTVSVPGTEGGNISIDRTIHITSSSGDKKEDFQILVMGNKKINKTVKIKLENVNISAPGYMYASAMSIYNNASVELTLVGDNHLEGAKGGNPTGYRDSMKPGGAGIEVRRNDDDISRITIKGTGSLEAIGGTNAAGIGGSGGDAGNNNVEYENSDKLEHFCGEINIENGNITARGGLWGAGIGDVWYGGGSLITISGGNIKAFGGNYSNEASASGIGGGYRDKGFYIHISGEETEIYSVGGTSGAGIGGGAGVASTAGNNAYITITGCKKIEAIGGLKGAGIGTGVSWHNKLYLEIQGGKEIIATGGANGPGIGGGSDFAGLLELNITNDPKIIATADDYFGAGIGTGYNTMGVANIDISGQAVITATGGGRGPGIGSGGGSNWGCVINISGNAVITATGGADGPGIGGGAKSILGCAINISGNPVIKAYGGNTGAGIGEGGRVGVEFSILSEITIEGGVIEAYGKGGGAGIGGGAQRPNGSITISGGSIKAQGFTSDSDTHSGAGIGSGTLSGYSGENIESPGEIIITGGTITAIGGDGAAGIGGAHSSPTNGTINISGGKITAKGGIFGAGIGGGAVSGHMDNINISGGTIVATGHYGAGLGSGVIEEKKEGSANEYVYSMDSKIRVTGGSINATSIDGEYGIVGEVKNNKDQYLYLCPIVVLDKDENPVKNSLVKDWRSNSEQIPYYQFKKDVMTDDKGVIYLLIPEVSNEKQRLLMTDYPNSTFYGKYACTPDLKESGGVFWEESMHIDITDQNLFIYDKGYLTKDVGYTGLIPPPDERLSDDFTGSYQFKEKTGSEGGYIYVVNGYNSGNQSSRSIVFPPEFHYRSGDSDKKISTLHIESNANVYLDFGNKDTLTTTVDGLHAIQMEKESKLTINANGIVIIDGIGAADGTGGKLHLKNGTIFADKPINVAEAVIDGGSLIGPLNLPENVPVKNSKGETVYPYTFKLLYNSLSISGTEAPLEGYYGDVFANYPLKGVWATTDYKVCFYLPPCAEPEKICLKIKGSEYQAIVSRPEGGTEIELYPAVDVNFTVPTGFPTPDPKSVYYQEKISCPEIISGRQIIRWYIDENGQNEWKADYEVSIANGVQVHETTEIKCKLPLYGIPEDMDVCYDLNGGKGIPPVDTKFYSDEETVTVKFTPLSREGYTFAGWSLYPDGKDNSTGDPVLYTEGKDDTFKYKGQKVTLYAQWRGSITYDANGGENPPADPAQYSPGEKVRLAQAGTMKNGSLVLLGWKTDPDGSRALFSPGGQYTFDGNTTFYAHWGNPPIPPIIEENPVGIQRPQHHDPSIYLKDDILHIEIPNTMLLSIFTATGRRHTFREIPTGSTLIQLSPGIYFIYLGGRTYKVIV